MKKRDFIKLSALGTLGAVACVTGIAGCFSKGSSRERKNWAWVHPLEKPENSDRGGEWEKLMTNLKAWGVDSVLLLVREKSIIDKVLPVAGKTGIELHGWIITMEYPDKATMKEHPSWYVVNGKGESCIEKPAYIDAYRWLCPSNPEVIEFTKSRVSELCVYNELAGVHLDYIRYPDVILAPAHRKLYDIPQDELIHPQFDYCYCDNCRAGFEQISGLDPLLIGDQATNEAWREFRHNSLTNIVNELYGLVHKSNKALSAAVFPTPGLSKLRVRQDWVNWKLDYVMPMIYQKYENKPVEWIGTAVSEGIVALAGKFPLLSGLHLYQLSPEESALAARLSLDAGASGLAYFTGNKMDDEYWNQLKSIKS